MPSATQRSGTIRIRRRSDQRPTTIRAMPPSTCVTARAAAAAAVETPRWSCRKRTKKPSRLSCGVRRRTCCRRRSARSAGRAGAGPTPKWSSAGLQADQERRRRWPRRKQPTASPRKAARRLTCSSRSGSATAPTAPPSGTAICRIPSASPRSSASEPRHHRAPARRVHAGAEAACDGERGGELRRTTTQTPAQTRAAAQVPSPTRDHDTLADDVRDETPRQQRHERAERTARRARRRSAVSVSPKPSRIAGAIAGRPSSVAA